MRFCATLLAAALCAAGPSAMAAKRPVKAPDVVEASVADLQSAMGKGRITSKQLVQAYLARIKSIDKAGPKLNSVIELNPDAVKEAEALDRERKAKGARGPLHGIPVLLKDNVATADRMQTTAGSIALVGARAPRDAFVAARLRQAGAVILGKANLSEWANFRSTRSTSGWSSRGGLTRNPYALDRNSSGSSSGSAVAVAASLAAIAVGTETDGSITSPASANNLVGIKPTLGLVSRAGIVPIAPSQDTAGPMARTVADAAVLLGAMAGTDPSDPATAQADAHRVDYAAHLDSGRLKGARLGVVRSQFGGRNDLASAQVERALEILRDKGAVLVEIPTLPGVDRIGNKELLVLHYEIKAAMGRYLAEYAPGFPIQTLADLIAFNEKNRVRTMPWFGQEHFVMAQAKGGLDTPEYVEARDEIRKVAREAIDKALAENNLDALVAPTGAPAWLTDFIRGDNSGGGFTSAAAVAGYPHVTVPAGFVHGLPCGISFVGTAWSEPRLIALAHAFESATRHRRAPTYPRTVNSWMPK